MALPRPRRPPRPIGPRLAAVPRLSRLCKILPAQTSLRACRRSARPRRSSRDTASALNPSSTLERDDGVRNSLASVAVLIAQLDHDRPNDRGRLPCARRARGELERQSPPSARAQGALDLRARSRRHALAAHRGRAHHSARARPAPRRHCHSGPLDLFLQRLTLSGLRGGGAVEQGCGRADPRSYLRLLVVASRAGRGQAGHGSVDGLGRGRRRARHLLRRR